jgi:hypothetical protein
MNDPLANLRAALAGRYALERELGRGGMATVYLARDLKHDRLVALKVLRPELARALGPKRFLREIRTTAQLDHPNIVPLYDSGQTGGHDDGPAESSAAGHRSSANEFLYYSMPYIEGESLRDRLEREGQLPLEEALQLAREIAEALSYAHSRAIVHRDIKPENVLLAGGHARVADFGIAKAVTEAGGENLTGTGVSIGTPAYMSPEQAEADKPVDGRSDLYSLGCVLYEMLAGHPPFAGRTAHELIVRHAADPVPPLRAARGLVPEGVEAAIERALAKAPADRFATATQFSQALALEPGVYRAEQRRRRMVRHAALGAGTVIVIAAAVWGVRAWSSRSAEATDPNAIPLDSTAIAVLPFHVVGANSASPARTLAMSVGDLFELKVTGEFGRRIRHPGSVAQRWRDAGGTLDSAISEESELAVARKVGAGRLVRGTVVALGDSLTVSASMIDVATGAVRVPPVRVEGNLAQQQELVDRLIVLLLSRDAGIVPTQTPRLSQYKPEAIQAYLAAMRSSALRERKTYYHAALAADSSFVDAALMIYAEGESQRDSAERRYALEHQDRLTERGRAYIQALAGNYETISQAMDAWDALARRWPEWDTPWYELGGKLVQWGAVGSVPDWRRRARQALEHVSGPDPLFGWDYVELAFLNEDTALARVAIDRVLATRDTGGPRVLVSRWRLAILRGDTTEADRVFARLAARGLNGSIGSGVIGSALADGRGAAYADRADPDTTRDVWWWARGREKPWREAWSKMALQPDATDLDRASVPVYLALLLGPSQDTVVADEVQQLERLATDAGRGRGQLLARCWLALWRARHGDTAAAFETREFLQHESVSRNWGAWAAGWVRTLDVLLAEARGGDVRAALLRMDSVVSVSPQLTIYGWWLAPVEMQNLMLARMLARYGEPERALAAARRRPQIVGWVDWYYTLPEYLREEGRLAALTGDTAGAINAYTHYLALRENPDPLWRAPWDSVRAELAALVAR